MKSLYWFRNDLRLNDNPSLNLAIEKSEEILFAYNYDTSNDKESSWGFKKTSQHRKSFLFQGVSELKSELNQYGHSLNIYVDDSVTILNNLVKKYKIDTIFCESIEVYEETKQIELLEREGVNVSCFWQSSLFMKHQLPFSIEEIPNVFTEFRKKIEDVGITPNKPINISKKIASIKSIDDKQLIDLNTNLHDYRKSSFPISYKKFMGGGKTGKRYLNSYFQSDKPKKYKETRNELMGVNFSTKFSPWLATGYLSAREIFFNLKKYESKITKNESTYWIFFELLWRDYFRFIMIKYGDKLFYKNGLNLTTQNINHDDENYMSWIEGKTDDSFINAGMIELKATGFLSNRMRQIVASYLINELSCDWRAGAAWFESQLIDYDVYSNQGNWAYMAGCGTDPRGGRFFNIEKQKKTYDSKSIYQNFWNQS